MYTIYQYGSSYVIYRKLTELHFIKLWQEQLQKCSCCQFSKSILKFKSMESSLLAETMMCIFIYITNQENALQNESIIL